MINLSYFKHLGQDLSVPGIPYQLYGVHLLYELACRADKKLSACAVLVRKNDEKCSCCDAVIGLRWTNTYILLCRFFGELGPEFIDDLAEENN